MNRQLPPLSYVLQHSPGLTLVITGRENLRRLTNINHVMRNPLPFPQGRLGRANIQISKNLDGIVVDNFTGKGFSKKQREFRFATSRGADDCDEGIHEWISNFELRISNLRSCLNSQFEIRNSQSQYSFFSAIPL